MENNQTTVTENTINVSKIGLIELKKILDQYTDYRIYINPSTDNNCIYKAIGIDPYKFELYTYKNGFYDYKNKWEIDLTITPAYRDIIINQDNEDNEDNEDVGEEDDFSKNTLNKLYVIANEGEKAYLSENKDRWNDTKKEITLGIAYIDIECRYEKPFGYTIDTTSNEFFTRVGNVDIPIKVDTSTSSYRDYGILYPLFNSLGSLLFRINDMEHMNIFFQKYFNINNKFHETAKTASISKTLKGLTSFYDQIETSIQSLTYFMFLEMSTKTSENIKGSVIFNKIFGDIKTANEFINLINDHCSMIQGLSAWDSSKDFLTKITNSLPEAREIKKEAIKKKSTGAFNKLMADLDFVTIDENKYPVTHKAVFDGDVPVGIFFRKSGETYFLYNDNWELWEPMLINHREIAIKIATEAAKRANFEKDIMSYFYFVLHGLPEYLEKHTGKKWTGIPKIVNSANELEPPKEGANGVAKTRSALTPIVDNENNTITVPYVSMAIHGYGTQYCYGLNFCVLDRGFTYQGNTVSRSVETKLNGRDDYGLMFYTLTGSATATGYPTFLIIFERLENTTRVHFHRTHPLRSKNGDTNPVHNWTIGCYKWMVGNVNFERIYAQQGDLAFVSIDSINDKGAEWTSVNSYDGHCFDEPVQFLPYTKKDNQNVLGYVKLDRDTILNHHEHMNRVIPEGIYEIRQCRSWEANPKGIWSLRID